MPNYNPYQQSTSTPKVAGRLEATLKKLQQCASSLQDHNDQLEQLATRVTGEVPSNASVSKLGQSESPQSQMLAIDMQVDRIERELARQQDVLQRLGQL